MGWRMAEGAASLVDDLLPVVRYRQWVLSFPRPMTSACAEYRGPLLYCYLNLQRSPSISQTALAASVHLQVAGFASATPGRLAARLSSTS